jgi:CRISPR/Cas system endoribonuclease Cas6 (RAMP superfamily)
MDCNSQQERRDQSMTEQIHFTLSGTPEPHLDSALAVKLHGFLMHQIPAALAEAYHANALRPYALYLRPVNDNHTWDGCLSILREDAAALADALLAAEQIPVGGMQTPLHISVSTTERYDLRSAADRLCSERLRLRFLTPAVYKLHSQPCCFPDFLRLFHSVLEKLQQFEGIAISDESFRQGIASLRVTDWKLTQTPFLITGRTHRGMTGMLECILPPDEAQSRMLKTVFAYASFCGVGARTAMGMGGFDAQPVQ